MLTKNEFVFRRLNLLLKICAFNEIRDVEHLNEKIITVIVPDTQKKHCNMMLPISITVILISLSNEKG